jgi:mono/diheme cytochrome c family protein
MKNAIRWSTGLMLSLVIGMPMVFAQQQHGNQRMMMPRVPADKLDEARALTSPLSQSPAIVEQGKAIYEGKGTCINCHGAKGRGDGPGAVSLNPPPRVFRSHGFWKHRSEGEIFWVIKYGSPGTAMIPFGGVLSDEEIWTVMQYERSFAGGHGPEGDQQGMSGMKGSQERSGHKEKGHDGEGCKRGGKDHHGKHHEDSLKQAEQAAGAAIHIQQAITAATEHVSGSAIEAEYETEEGQAFWEITIVSDDGKLLEVNIDSENGNVLSVEEKSPEEKHKRMRKRKGKMGEHEGDHEGCSKEKSDNHGESHKEH